MLSKLKSICTAALLIAALAATASTITHKVQKGDTVYGISHKYGLSIDELYKYNPAARDGLRVGQVLILPGKDGVKVENVNPNGDENNSQPQNVINQNSSDRRAYHTVKRGETLYGIAKQYNMDLQQLLALNPSVDANGYAEGTVLRLTDKTALPSQPVVVVEPGQKEMTPAPVIDTDPGLVVPPVSPEPQTVENQEDKTPVVEPTPTPVVEPTPTPVIEPDTTAPGVEEEDSVVAPAPAPVVEPVKPAPVLVANNDDPITIALILPFHVGDKSPSKKAAACGEFYRGFVLAADSLSHSGRPVRIKAYDTHNSIDSLNAILALPELTKASAIVTPDDEAQVAVIGEFAKNNRAWAVNMYAVKDTTYLTNPYMIQGNIPHDEMYGKAIDQFIKQFRSYTPIFLDYTVGSRDKKEFVEMLQAQLSADSIEYQVIEFSDALSDAKLKALDREGKYIFIPTGSSKKEFTKFIGALKTFKEEFIDPDDVKLFGFPEWTIFRDDNLKNLSALNTTIYSRFYHDTTDYRVTSIEDEYLKWYGHKMTMAYPTSGLLGFDAGYFLINKLRSGDDLRHTSRYDGVQTSFDLDGDDDTGLVNMGLYFIHFRPSGFIDKAPL